MVVKYIFKKRHVAMPSKSHEFVQPLFQKLMISEIDGLYELY